MIIIETAKSIWDGLDWSVLTNILIAIVPALLCLTFHEVCHGLVAYRLGDPTAKNAGRLTFNPIKHLDPIGLLMMVIFHFGWAKPVPINMNNFKRPKIGMAITALAGPLSNLVLAVVVLFIYGLFFGLLAQWGTAGKVIMELFITTAYLSVAFAIFNIIPLPPLDGSKVLFSFLPNELYYKLMRYERFGMIILLILVGFNLITPFLSTVTGSVYGWLAGVAEWSYSLVY